VVGVGGYTVYTDRFDTDDLLHRVLVLAGMLAVIAMALSIHDALHGGSAQFALAFVAVRGIVLLLNVRARRHAAAARPLLNLYLTAFSIGAALWLVSVLVPEPARYLLWGWRWSSSCPRPGWDATRSPRPRSTPATWSSASGCSPSSCSASR
jgi:low temperature requirement protein LtrA